jgi:hypothetical protein
MKTTFLAPLVRVVTMLSLLGAIAARCALGQISFFGTPLRKRRNYVGSSVSPFSFFRSR